MAVLRDARPTLWNHTLAGSYKTLDGLPGVHLYPARALCLTHPGDVVQLPADLQDEFDWITEHYQAVGIDCTNCVEWDLSLNIGDHYPELDKAFWLYGPEADQGRNPARVQAVTQFNDKNWFIKWTKQHRLPVPETECFEHGQRPNPRGLKYPLFVKGAVAASSEENFKCWNWAQALAAIAKIPGDYQIQEFLRDAVAWLNVQYYGQGGQASFMTTTEQILDEGSVHAGNRYPTKFDPRRVTDPAAKLAVDLGLEDVFAFDVPVLKNGRHLLLECNPRPNGATYPTVVAARLGIRQWISINLKTDRRSLHDADFGPTLFNGATGVVVINWGPIKEGKIQVLVAGNPNEQNRILGELAVRGFRAPSF